MVVLSITEHLTYTTRLMHITKKIYIFLKIYLKFHQVNLNFKARIFCDKAKAEPVQ